MIFSPSRNLLLLEYFRTSQNVVMFGQGLLNGTLGLETRLEFAKEIRRRLLFWWYNYTLLSAFVCFVHIYVAAETALATNNYSNIFFRGKNLYICMLFRTKNPVTFYFWMQTRYSLAFVCGPIAYIMIVCLFLCLLSWQIRLYFYHPSVLTS